MRLPSLWRVSVERKMERKCQFRKKGGELVEPARSLEIGKSLCVSNTLNEQSASAPGRTGGFTHAIGSGVDPDTPNDPLANTRGARNCVRAFCCSLNQRRVIPHALCHPRTPPIIDWLDSRLRVRPSASRSPTPKSKSAGTRARS
jgi:hypothetical protein